jgi:hypothetical protein
MLQILIYKTSINRWCLVDKPVSQITMKISYHRKAAGLDGTGAIWGDMPCEDDRPEGGKLQCRGCHDAQGA